MRISLRHPNGSHSFLDEGSAYGHQLLQHCVEHKIDVQCLGRKGVTLPPIQKSSKVGKSLRRIYATGTESILGESINDFGKAREIEFNACHLHSWGTVHHVQHKEMNEFLKDTFHSVMDSMHLQGFSTSLSRFDLFHGHMFRSDYIEVSRSTTTTTTTTTTTPQALLGILFHCSEFPAKICKKSDTNEPKNDQSGEKSILEGIDLGYCQEGSDCSPSLKEWRFRNALWLAWWPSHGITNRKKSPHHLQQAIWLLDGAAPEMSKLRVDATEFGTDCPNTINEDFLGTPIGDIFLLNDSLYFTPQVLHEPSSFHLF